MENAFEVIIKNSIGASRPEVVNEYYGPAAQALAEATAIILHVQRPWLMIYAVPKIEK